MERSTKRKIRTLLAKVLVRELAMRDSRMPATRQPSRLALPPTNQWRKLLTSISACSNSMRPREVATISCATVMMTRFVVFFVQHRY